MKSSKRWVKRAMRSRSSSKPKFMDGRESAIEGALLEERGARIVLVEREGSKRVAIVVPMLCRCSLFMIEVRESAVRFACFEDLVVRVIARVCLHRYGISEKRRDCGASGGSCVKLFILNLGFLNFVTCNIYTMVKVA